MDPDMLAYGGGGTGIEAKVSVPDLPFPIEYSAETIQANLSMPISKTDTPTDFSLAVILANFNVSDMIWGMGDPGGALPHDPATLVVDLVGKAQWLVDIMNPEEASKMDVPGMLHALTLKALQLKIAGADLTGSGAFTFDNNDLVSFEGLPKPTGSVDLKLVGGNGLLDNLIKMGLVPADDAMGVRMMMGLFAVAGEAEDTLTSKIEINEQGHILANGQRLK
jgi:hypothetical protein